MEKPRYEPIPHHLKSLAGEIIDAACTVHKHLGPGLLERVYETCFCYELSSRGVFFLRQVDVPIVYKDMAFQEALRLDVLVEHNIICALKAVDEIHPVWAAQVLSHLKLANKRLGFLINFNVPRMKNGIRRFVI